jgi:hypothetical protein
VINLFYFIIIFYNIKTYLGLDKEGRRGEERRGEGRRGEERRGEGRRGEERGKRGGEGEG